MSYSVEMMASHAAQPGSGSGRRALALTIDDIDNQQWDIDEKLAALWRAARLGPTVERLRRHVLQAGDRSIESGQFRALDAIAAHGPCPVRELAAVIGVEPSTVTRATARLEASGLIKKSRATADQRQVMLELTDEGARRHRYFVDRAYETYEEIFARFSPEERALLADLLERMLKSTEAVLTESER